MANNTLDKAIEAIPILGKRIKLFTEKLRIAQYADNSIYDYRLKIAQAVLFFNKLPVGVWHHLNGCEKSDFLFPVHGMSYKFYGRFMKLLTRRLKEENYIIADYIRYQCKNKHWVVYSRPPAKGVNQVLEYIARYALRNIQKQLDVPLCDLTRRKTLYIVSFVA